MGKLIFSFTNFIGIKVEKIRLPLCVDAPQNLRTRYVELLPEISTMVRPYPYIATSEKSEAAYIREMEGIPDLFPLVTYPGTNVDGHATIISMIGLYINELTSSGIDNVESACQIIEQTLNDVGLEYDLRDIEILMMIPKFSIELSDTPQENIMEENPQLPPITSRNKGDQTRNKPVKPVQKKRQYVPRPITVGDMLGAEFVAELYKKVNQSRK
jgi:hypothetical protein